MLTPAANARIFSMVGLDTRFLGVHFTLAASVVSWRMPLGFTRKTDLNISEEVEREVFEAESRIPTPNHASSFIYTAL